MSANIPNDPVAIQRFFTSRDNNANASTYVGQEQRLWYDPITNAIYVSDGNTAGGIAVGTATGTGIPVGPINSVQLNQGGGNFTGSTNLVFSNNVLNVVGNVSATGNIQGNVFIGNGSQLTGVITSLGNAFATVSANGTSLVANSSADTVTINSGNNLVITSNAGTDTMTISVADAPVFSGNVTSGNIIANAIVNNSGGNVYVTGNLLPTNNSYNLGLATVPWANAFFGPRSITILDETGNIGNSVVIENIAANIVIGTTGFTINEFGTPNSIFRIEALTGQIFSNAKTIIQNTTNADNTYGQGALQVKGGASVVKDFYVGGNIYGTGAQLSNVVNRITTGVGLTQTASTGNVGLDATGVQTVVGTANQINVANVAQNLTLSLPQGIATNSTVTFANLTITGNLTVNGTTTTANAESLNGKILYLANASTSNTQIDGGGIILGNASSSYKRSILYSLTNDWWDTDGAGFNTLALTASDANIANLIARGTAHFGEAYEGYDYPYAGVQVDANVNSYSQIISINHNPGTSASSDFVATNDIGTDSNNYIDLGINSSTYANADYAVSGANDGYLYINGGNLAIGTQSPANVINFFTGGTNVITNIRAVLSDTELAMKNANVLVQDGNDNEIIELRTDGNIVFNGSQTLQVNGGFYVSSVNQSGQDPNIVGYNGGQFTAGPSLKDYPGNIGANNFTATGNISGNNIKTVGIISATGNITGNYFIGNGSQITGLPVTYGNANVVANLTALGSNPVSTTGNITASYILGNGSQLTGVIHNLGNAFTTISSNGTSITAATSTSTATLTPGNNMTIVGNTSTNITVFSVVDAPVFTGNVQGSNIKTAGLVSATGNIIGAYGVFSNGNTVINSGISTTGNITANYFIGNGSQLTNLNVGIGGNQLVYVLNAQQTIGSAKNTLLSLFGLTNGVALTSNTRYQYELLFNAQCSKAGTLSYALALGGGAVLAQHNYNVISNKTTGSTDAYAASVTMMSQNATGAAIITAQTVADTATFTHTIIQGTIDVTTGGNVNFMVSQDQNTPVTWTVNAGSYVKLLPLGPIGANTVDGTWS